jgi:hypothetical protein
MAKPAFRVLVQVYPYHTTVIADIFEVAGANVVLARCAQDADPGRYQAASHRMSDFPNSGVWKPEEGIYVVPCEQVRELKPLSVLPNEPKLKR